MLKLIEIVILWVYYTIPFGFSFFRDFLGIIFQLYQLPFWLRITDEGSIPEMRICSILIIISDLNGVYILVEVSINISTTTVLCQCHCWWTKESPSAHVAKFFGRLPLICSVLRASKFSALKLIEFVILWVYYTIPFSLSFF